MADGTFHSEDRTTLNLRKMKTTNFFSLVVAVGLLALAGCKKADQPGSVEQFHGINVDLPKLDTEFAKSGADVQDSLTLVKRFFRYAQFPQALMELDKLSKNPNLTEPQKKLVNELIEQTRQVITKSPPLPGP